MAELPIELAKNRAWPLLERLNHALAAGEIDEAAWYREIAAVIVPAYLAGDTPAAQSGNSSTDEAQWAYRRDLIADAVHCDGTFLDVGCANGYLMETLTRWCRQRGYRITPFGLDISPELVELARTRLPHWASHMFVGNAIDWLPPHRFDFVRTGLEYVPPTRRRDLIERLLREVVAPSGRLIIGVHSEERNTTRTEPSEEEMVSGWGFTVAGHSERPHAHDARLTYRVCWIDR